MPRTVNFTDLGIEDAHQISQLSGNDISWGEPAKICQARIDRACPICGARAKDIQYSGNQLIAGFESDGKDGMCGGCGYTFATGSCEAVKAPEDTTPRKQSRRKGKKAARTRAGKGVRSKG